MQDTRPFDYSQILDYWDISYQKSHPEIVISGSPQRSSYRIVVEDNNQKMYILERIPEDKVQHKRLICQTVSYLSDQNINGIHSYVRNKDNTFLTRINSSYWQVIPHISNISLNRPGYVFDEWRGKVLAEFLINLWKISLDISKEISLPFFSLKKYVISMVHKMKQFDTAEYQKLKSVISYLTSDFLVHYEEIPSCFCHGDYHPLNIIWGKRSVKAVIDWEFTGEKIEIYDMANLLGCLGIEEPTSLVHDFALSFIKEIKESGHISQISFHYLFDCMMALRFAWLAEWLKSNDSDMIQLEIDFLHLIYENKTIIKKKWEDV
jgi:homoserine kinase type II